MKQYDIQKMSEELFEGMCIAKPEYQEILRFHRMLDDAGIPHELTRLYDGWKIAFYTRDGVQISDVVEHFGSYGSNIDKMEMMGLTESNDVQGYMSAEDAFVIWSKNYWQWQWRKG